MSQPLSQTPLLDFYRDSSPTPEGHTYSSVLSMSDNELEGHHDYVQWLFPTTKPSMFHDAPVLTAYEAKVMASDPALRGRIVEAFRRILLFWDFRLVGDSVVCEGIPPVMRSFNHNWLRMTRVIASLRELGHRDLAARFCHCLLKFPNVDMSRKFWVEAASGTPKD
jgi:hypothetical protein